jgi:hypothetical protein
MARGGGGGGGAKGASKGGGGGGGEEDGDVLQGLRLSAPNGVKVRQMSERRVSRTVSPGCIS